MGGAPRDMVMNLLLLLLLALPFACLALLSFVAFLGVAAIGGALSVIRHGHIRPRYCRAKR